MKTLLRALHSPPSLPASQPANTGLSHSPLRSGAKESRWASHSSVGIDYSKDRTPRRDLASDGPNCSEGPHSPRSSPRTSLMDPCPDEPHESTAYFQETFYSGAQRAVGLGRGGDGGPDNKRAQGEHTTSRSHM